MEKPPHLLLKSEAPEVILDATDHVLHRVGFAPQSSRNPAGSPGSMNQQNNFFIGQADLLAAQELMAGAARLPSALGPIATQAEAPPAEGNTYEG